MLSNLNFERSISLNDLDSTLRVREYVQEDIVTPEDEGKHSYLLSTSKYTFVLKSFKDFHVDFKRFLYTYLVDFAIFRELEECRRLNWCEGLFPMIPVLTLGDGNCLMHAASIAMWAVSDRYHTLRKLVYSALLEDLHGFYHKRWQREHETITLNRHRFEMTEEQWAKEWQILLDLVSQDEFTHGPNGMQFSSLEEIHIFVLANVLRRTIIVVSNDVQHGNYDEPLSPLNFPGVYLPLKWDPIDCVRTPLVIGYAQGHFTAIVSFEDGIFDRGEMVDGVDDPVKIHGIPLETCDGELLPVHFLFEDEEDLKDGLLRQYLDCVKLKSRDPQDGNEVVTLAANMHFVPPPDCVTALVDGFFSTARETYQLMVRQKNEHTSLNTPSLQLKPCQTEGCDFFGTQETLYFCSKCLEDYLRKEGIKQLSSTVKPEDTLYTGEYRYDKEQQWQQQLQQQQQEQHQQREYQLMQRQQNKQQQQQQQQQQQLLPLEYHKQPRQFQQHQLQQEQELQLIREQQQLLQHQQQVQQQQQHQKLFPEYQEERQQHQQQQNKNLQQQQQQQGIHLQQQQQQMVPPQETPRTKPDKQCRTSGCKYTAVPECGDLCLRCHESEILAEQQTASLRSINAAPAPCANSVNGCIYFGIPQQEGFCSRCYRRFCLEMQSLRNVESSNLPSSNVTSQQPLPQVITCQTQGCTKPGCPELYNRCVECYGNCIKDFIQSHAGQSMEMFASAAITKRVPLPPPPLPPSPPLPTHCSVSGCQNEGLPQFNGRCIDCYQIRPSKNPLELQKYPNLKSQAGGMALAANEPGRPIDPRPAEPISQQNSLLFCGTPKCGKPLGEATGTLCTKCIMKKTQIKRKISPQQQQPYYHQSSSSSSSSDEEVEIKRSERRAEILQARQKLPPLYIPASGAPQSRSRFGGTASPMAAAAIKPGASATSFGGNEMPASGTRCLTANCPFFATPETQFLCSSCYEKEKREWKKIEKMTHRLQSQALASTSRLPPVSLPNPPGLKKCALKNCPNWESPGKDGLCDRCYQVAVRNERTWDSENRQTSRRIEPQRQQPVTTQRQAPPLPRKSGFVDAGFPCKTSGCLKFGTKANGGLCDPCFEKHKKKQALKTSPSPLSVGASPVFEGRERMVPTGQGQQFTHDPFTASPMIAPHDPVPVSQQHSRVFGVGADPRKCRQEGCRMTGSADFGGYCSKCFEDYTRMNSYPESVPDLTTSGETQTKLKPPGLTSPTSTNSKPVSTGLTTLPLTSPRTCAIPECSNQVQPSTMSLCRECLAKLYPEYARSKQMT